jgi:hypothetical protein
MSMTDSGSSVVRAGKTALLKIAGSVVAPVLKGWLGRRRDARERDSSLTDLINTGMLDDLGGRRAHRWVRDITDAVYERLFPLVNGRFGALPDNELTRRSTRSPTRSRPPICRTRRCSPKT